MRLCGAGFCGILGSLDFDNSGMKKAPAVTGARFARHGHALAVAIVP